jgi:hypothetical protein
MLAVVVTQFLFAVGPASAVESARARLTATINGRPVDRIDGNRPLRLLPSAGAVVKVQVLNKTDVPLTVRLVRLHGKVMGLTFYTYDTLVDMHIGPGQTDEREFLVDLSDLRGQATGLLPGQLTLLDDRRKVVASDAFPVDVRGSMGSVYGVFGLLVAAITGLLLVAALVRLAAHRLPLNRWSRAMRFAIPGIGIGLVLTFSLSAFRVFTPSVGMWLPLVLLGGAAGFVVGYLTPTPAVRYVRHEVGVDA